ncbi:GGDEF domain-containing protein [Marinobacter sp. ANT_B65]|uniref:GGDEF domain-containing protein n=1 Tax=Marinobacter sp. ANT_B65 TaxID=2039467 RepID=UPI000BBEA393|nr:GGDEF domain-containing protein [Marinobacter sp. ANT_B65]PCM44278.1 GGDEF domain-containing protein [Marinobacter sp. ANT_B65]
MLSRLKTDFQLSIITLLGACALLGVTPFAALRFIQGNLVTGIVDVLVLGCIVSGMAYAWITGDTRRSGFVLAIVVCCGSVAAGVAGKAGFFWLYPCLMVSFFLVSPRGAVFVNLVAIASAMTMQDGAFQSSVHMWSFFSTTVMTSVCAYVFAFRNERHRESLQLLASVDPLTGVKNRRSMDEGLRSALMDARRTGRFYAVIMMDIDHFKKINDEHGHGIGDQVLLSLVSLIQQRIRKTDQLFRFGGEEFVLILSGVDCNGLKQIANDLQAHVRQQLRCGENAVTVSFGVARLHPDGTAEGWLKRADAALYEAKGSGRDQIVFAENISGADVPPGSMLAD